MNGVDTDAEYTTGTGYDSTNGYYIIRYTNNAWSTVTLDNLPTYTAVAEKEVTVMKEITGYYVVEQGMTDKPITVTYQIDNGTTAEACASVINGSITIINTDQTGKVQVSKSFSGIEALPAEFKITASWADGSENGASVELTASGDLPTVTGLTFTRTGSGTADAPYIWTIDGLPVGTEVTFTETGYTAAGYTWTGTVNGNTPEGEMTGTATVSAAATLPATAVVYFVNTYQAGVELPSTGGPGTVLYTATGLTLLLGAALWLFLRRKREQN